MKKMKLRMETAMTFEDGYKEYLLNCEARNLRQGTIKHYNDAIRQIYKIIPEETPISSIDENTWDYYRIGIKADGNKNSMSIYTYSRDFKTLLRFFMKQGWIEPFEIELPKVDKTPTETYTDTELMALLKKPSLRKCGFSEYKNWVITNLLMSTGMRQNSLINLRIKDIDFNSGYIHINVTKNRKPLIVPLNRDILAILKEYLKYRQSADENDFLFCNEYGMQLTKSTFYHGMYYYNKARGVEQTGIHRYRHTFAKKWVLMGGNVVTLQKILGHSSLEITQNYLNLLVSDIKVDIDEYNILREFKRESIKIQK